MLLEPLLLEQGTPPLLMHAKYKGVLLLREQVGNH